MRILPQKWDLLLDNPRVSIFWGFLRPNKNGWKSNKQLLLSEEPQSRMNFVSAISGILFCCFQDFAVHSTGRKVEGGDHFCKLPPISMPQKSELHFIGEGKYCYLIVIYPQFFRAFFQLTPGATSTSKQPQGFGHWSNSEKNRHFWRTKRCKFLPRWSATWASLA